MLGPTCTPPRLPAQSYKKARHTMAAAPGGTPVPAPPTRNADETVTPPRTAPRRYVHADGQLATPSPTGNYAQSYRRRIESLRSPSLDGTEPTPSMPVPPPVPRPALFRCKRREEAAQTLLQEAPARPAVPVNTTGAANLTPTAPAQKSLGSLGSVSFSASAARISTAAMLLEEDERAKRQAIACDESRMRNRLDVRRMADLQVALTSDYYETTQRVAAIEAKHRESLEEEQWTARRLLVRESQLFRILVLEARIAAGALLTDEFDGRAKIADAEDAAWEEIQVENTRAPTVRRFLLASFALTKEEVDSRERVEQEETATWTRFMQQWRDLMRYLSTINGAYEQKKKSFFLEEREARMTVMGWQVAERDGVESLFAEDHARICMAQSAMCRVLEHEDMERRYFAREAADWLDQATADSNAFLRRLQEKQFFEQQCTALDAECTARTSVTSEQAHAWADLVGMAILEAAAARLHFMHRNARQGLVVEHERGCDDILAAFFVSMNELQKKFESEAATIAYFTNDENRWALLPPHIPGLSLLPVNEDSARVLIEQQQAREWAQIVSEKRDCTSC
eukprot:TRINITY_DN7833_c0_g1_i1.p1 TRINITY_DN7833_c0_g1~~TRINITY_DN7833_c0_g1_i1.p1  ORF type:complete len:571 (-),score=94.43 TRINITY_DN7833_c0_g1_i1:2-1714(-)